MKRDLIRSPLCAVLSGMMLMACGGPEETGLAQAEDLGTQESAICSGSSVSTLSSSGFSSWGGEAAGAGSWTVAYPANGIHVDYYIDGALRGSSDIQGNASRSGSWNFSYSPVSCGSHKFEAKGYPITLHSNGTIDRCPSSGPKTLTVNFTQACASASLSCSRTSSTYVTCTGSASSGAGAPYTPLWQQRVEREDGSTYTSAWSQGSMSRSFYCPFTNIIFPSDMLTVSFKVRDASGMESQATFGNMFICEAGSY